MLLIYLSKSYGHMVSACTDIVNTGILPHTNLQSVLMWYLDYDRIHKIGQSGFHMEVSRSHYGFGEHLKTVKDELENESQDINSLPTCSYAL